jgi:prepilin signal peptidase PulO-like enzyme (type II secretory pathway)
MIGVFLGVTGTINAVAVGALLAVLSSIVLRIVARGEIAGRIPFAPFLSAGAIFQLFGGTTFVLTPILAHIHSY